MSLSQQYQVRFVTKEKQFAIPSQVYEIKTESSLKELNSLVNQVLKSSHEEHQTQEFAFLTNGYLLKERFSDHLETIEEDYRGAEAVIEVEYFVRTQTPEPFNSFLNNDWVSSVQANGEHVLNGCYDGTVNVWSLQDGQHKLTVPAHKAPVKAIHWVSTGALRSAESLQLGENDLLFISSSYDETSALWKWNTQNDQVEKMQVYKGHIRSVDCLDVFDQVLVTGSYDKMIKLWLMNQKKSDVEKEAADEEVPAKKKRTQDNIIKSPYTTLKAHAEAITDLCWMVENESKESNENKAEKGKNLPDLASCSMDNTIRIWDMELFQEKQTLKGSKAFLTMNYSPVNRMLITGACDNFVRLFDPRANEGSIVRAGYSSHSGWVTSVCWRSSHAYHFLSGSMDKSVKQWDLRSTKAPLFDLLGHEENVMAVDWTNAGYMISGSADNHIKIFRAS